MDEDKVSKAASLLGRKGGAKRVPKGFAKMSRKRVQAAARKALKKRWDRVRAERKAAEAAE